jgi:hypothetical protein
MEPGGSLPHLQQPVTHSYAGSDDLFLKYIIEENITCQQQLPFTVVKIKSNIVGLYFLLLFIFLQMLQFPF